ncbi:MAG: hypothetical protein GYA24_22435 [Candidatus Lokiarchaeota archaeon]|nr:hypothetical protein [Candidatus Lokiarchaeota archaeon]
MSFSLDKLKEIIQALKEVLLEKPKTKLWLEDVARAAGVDVKMVEAVHDLLSDLDSMLVDVEVERELRGKYFRYFPDDDGDDEDDEEFEDVDEDEEEP